MPEKTKFLFNRLSESIVEAIDLASKAEGSDNFTQIQRFFVYEVSYLLAYSSWENFLEQTFFRFLCGYENSSGSISLAPGIVKCKTIQQANLLVLGGKQFKLWHNPQIVIDRSKGFFTSGPHEAVLNSAKADIDNFAAIRHYVAHRSEDTKLKFKSAAVSMIGGSLAGDRPGRFLRLNTIDPVTNTSMTWLDRICGDIERYAKQIGD